MQLQDGGILSASLGLMLLVSATAQPDHSCDSLPTGATIVMQTASLTKMVASDVATYEDVFVDDRNSWKPSPQWSLMDVFFNAGADSSHPGQSSASHDWWPAGVQQSDALGQAPKARRNVFFRPTSVTLWCVMLLTIQSILIHTCAAIARNSDDLTARPQPSYVTDVLETASHSLPLAPTMGMLFLAMRVFTLENTHGLGEPMQWVKSFMVLATIGMFCQVLAVMMLGVTAVRKEGKGFTDLGGRNNGAHPHVLMYDFNGGTRGINLVLQFMSIFGIYLGVTGVALGMATTGENVGPDSAACSCATMLVMLYFFVHFSVWAATTPAAKAGALRADAAVQKAPMFVVLLLTTRLRMVTDTVAGGAPSPLLRAAFSLIVIAVYLEVVISTLLPGDPWEDEEDNTSPADAAPAEQNDELAPSVAPPPPRGRRLAVIARASVAILGFTAACVVAHSIKWPWGRDKVLPMSPTVRSVMMLCLMYFVVQLLLTLYALLRSLFHLSSTRARDAMIAARNSLGCCPLLCVLFLGCRMRALQLTESRGMPQAWEADFLFLCVGATALEVICCLAMPMFFREVNIDAEGNPTFQNQSVTGNIIILVTRYVALLGLHAGVIGICVSVFTMTPESCMVHNMNSSDVTKSVGRALVWTLVVLVSASCLSSAKAIGLIVKIAIESVDEIFLGTEITVEAAVLSLWRGDVIIRGLVVKNPPNHTWQTDCLLSIDVVAVKLDLCRIIRSLGMDIRIREIVVNGVTLIYELGIKKAPSNIGALLDYLDPKKDEEKADAPTKPLAAPEPKPESAQRKETGCLQVSKKTKDKKDDAAKARPQSTPEEKEKDEEKDEGSTLNLVVGKILLKNIFARVVHPVMGDLARVSVGDLNIENFSDQSIGRSVSDIILFVLKTLLRTATSNADIVKMAFQQGTSHVVHSVAGGCRQCGSSLCKCCGCGGGLLAAASGTNTTSKIGSKGPAIEGKSSPAAAPAVAG